MTQKYPSNGLGFAAESGARACQLRVKNRL